MHIYILYIKICTLTAVYMRASSRSLDQFVDSMIDQGTSGRTRAYLFGCKLIRGCIFDYPFCNHASPTSATCIQCTQCIV